MVALDVPAWDDNSGEKTAGFGDWTTSLPTAMPSTAAAVESDKKKINKPNKHKRYNKRGSGEVEIEASETTSPTAIKRLKLKSNTQPPASHPRETLKNKRKRKKETQSSEAPTSVPQPTPSPAQPTPKPTPTPEPSISLTAPSVPLSSSAKKRNRKRGSSPTPNTTQASVPKPLLNTTTDESQQTQPVTKTNTKKLSKKGKTKLKGTAASNIVATTLSEDTSSKPDTTTPIAKKKYKKNKNKNKNKKQEEPSSTPVSLKPKLPKVKLTTAQKRLQGARFRMLNEKLYTTTGGEAFALFASNPILFDVYHDGFKTQVEKWPVNPVDKAIAWVKTMPTSHIIADFGCGEAAIAQSVANTVHSFDLVAHNEFVTACDISHTPLQNDAVDIAVFSLALMGTNYTQYIQEAHRVLKNAGKLRIYEVLSRIQDMEEFIAVIEAIGFDFITQGPPNKMFVELNFVKSRKKSNVVDAQPLLPCIYKRR